MTRAATLEQTRQGEGQTTARAPPVTPRLAAAPDGGESDFARMLKTDRGVEWRIFWGEMIALACMIALALWGLASAGVRL